jgi:two-component sensor histidine kinase
MPAPAITSNTEPRTETTAAGHSPLPPIAQSTAKPLLAGILVLILLLLLLVTAELPLYVHSAGVPLWQVLVIGFSEVLVVGGWLLFDLHSPRYGAAPPPDRPVRWFWHHARRLPLLAMGFIAGTYTLRWLAFAAFGAAYRPYWPIVLPYESFKVLLLLCCWLALIFGICSFLQMRIRTEHLLRLEKNLAQAQLAQLEAQLQPHFLFNALNTISSFIHEDAKRADRLLAQLGDLLRVSLAHSERAMVTLAEELDLLHRYAEIMQARFAERVHLEWHVEAGLQEVLVPAMLLQPLLENAFKHGVERDPQPQVIHIRASSQAMNLRFAIHNTRSNLSPPVSGGVGLSNCRERLQLLYGEQASLELYAHHAGGVEVAVTLPAQRANS